MHVGPAGQIRRRQPKMSAAARFSASRRRKILSNLLLLPGEELKTLKVSTVFRPNDGFLAADFSQKVFQLVTPPSTTCIDPVMYEESSEARNKAALAISSG
jgi:hypothetical protein